MRKSTFSLVKEKEFFLKHIKGVDQKTLAKWAIDCTERVLPFFEAKYPQDDRPRKAIIELKAWIITGKFSMKVIRKASLDSHAAARFAEDGARRAKEIGNDSPAASVAHAAGQTVATAHVSTHAIGAAIYALQAIHRATGSDEEVSKERKWQYQHLLNLRKK